ncbi:MULTISPECIES: formate--tetrahydrofolate ligase [unclassified Streptococcus]|uniref:formate--tetrahydrofolate ligase n=1 Tax=unclassified Streptococcus TaxID=2608887 RepID=UPI001072800A|nr:MULTISPECIES: formate--tetrahydrofolate ligase [unclassified Streptococcus]MBF0805196.1 formate--tetrahydrofolate ligase [Streptococcus sp. 19428wA2_WM07]TFU29235.1 formate--tetrahydrofolate ligase [Streptococcus sp. WM07]
MKTDIQIAQESSLKPIIEIAASLGLESSSIEQYGPYKGKIAYETLSRLKQEEAGKLILVTAINPTPAGEGKSTVTIGLADSLAAAGHKTMIALREPSLGPVMGLKGGAAGGGYAQVLPMEDINLHFTGDMHALTSAHNTLSALIDNHLHQGNDLDLDPSRIVWKRVLDINDRSLRQIVIGLGGPINGQPREDGFDITVASEMMAILCLAQDLQDLEQRLSNILIGYKRDGSPVFVKDLGAAGALTLLLKDALKPNLVQTIYGTPALVHGGPFANIAHGCNSVVATETALSLADITVTEAGFGADLGAEKFLDIKVPHLRKAPDAIVVVATIRALKMHGGLPKQELTQEDLTALEAGFANLHHHVQTLASTGKPVVVALNRFSGDTSAELELLKHLCLNASIPIALTEVWEKGPLGGQELVELLLPYLSEEKDFTSYYDRQGSFMEKLESLVQKAYGAQGVDLTPKAVKQLKEFQRQGWDHFPICMAKTPYSLSDNPSLGGRPQDFRITIREFQVRHGAGFIVALAGNVLTMPGLPKQPAALKMGLDADGHAFGLF